MENPQNPQMPETDEQKDIKLNKDVAAFGYIWIMSVVVYASRRDSKFVQFHSKQGIVLFLLTLPVSVIPFIGKYLLLLIVAGMLLGFINAAQGQKRDVPFAGPLSRGELTLEGVTKIITLWYQRIAQAFSSLRKSHVKHEPKTEPAKTLPPIQR